MVTARLSAAVLALVCALALPFLGLMQLLQAVFGSAERSKNMAYAVSRYGNALFGGSPSVTISLRVGNGVRAGQRWALILAPCIDFFFGKNHCLDAVS